MKDGLQENLCQTSIVESMVPLPLYSPLLLSFLSVAKRNFIDSLDKKKKEQTLKRATQFQ